MTRGGSPGAPALALVLALGLPGPARPCHPPSTLEPAPAGWRAVLTPAGSLAELAARSGLPLSAVFRGLRRSGRVLRLACGSRAGATHPGIGFECGEGDRGLPAATFFERMPLTRWRTPEDGRWAVSRSGGKRRHKGLDLHAPEGSPVYTVAPGRVVRAWKVKPLGLDGGFGNYVIVEHPARDGKGLAYRTFYTHMLRPPAVREGDELPAGFKVGHVGRTPIGRFTNPHLHFEVRLADGTELGLPVNPTAFGAFRARFTAGEGAF